MYAPRHPIFLQLSSASLSSIPYITASIIPVAKTRWTYMINGVMADDEFTTAHAAEWAATARIRGALIADLALMHRFAADLHPTRERDRPDPSSPQGENYLVSLISRAGHTVTIRTSRAKAHRYLATARHAGAKVGHRRPVVQEPDGRKRNAEEWQVTFDGKKRCHIVTLACRAPKRKPDPVATRVDLPDAQKPWWEE